jgi:hypothetical protein
MYRPGVNEIFLLSRHLRLEGLNAGKSELIVSAIDNMTGINEVSIDEDRGILNLSYDASQLSIDQIEKIIKQTGNSISHDWWTQLKKRWYRFTDSNTQSNASHQPGCCSKLPRD